MFYIGYSAHHDWLAAVDRNRPVNALTVIETGVPSEAGVAENTQVILLSQTEDTSVHYLRLITDSYQTVDGHNALFNHAMHERRAESAWDIVRAWLDEQGLHVRSALLSLPKSIRPLTGRADGLLRYDKDIDAWVRDLALVVPAEMLAEIH